MAAETSLASPPDRFLGARNRIGGVVNRARLGVRVNRSGGLPWSLEVPSLGKVS
jgi:hypothetical protein